MMKFEVAAQSVAQDVNHTNCWRVPNVLMTAAVEVVVNCESEASPPVAGAKAAISTVVVGSVMVAG